MFPSHDPKKQIGEDMDRQLSLAESRADVGQKRADLVYKTANIRPELLKNLPEDERKHLVGLKEAYLNNPETGEVESVGFQLKPGLVATSDQVVSADGLKDMRKSANELNEDRAFLNTINQSTAKIIKILTQMEENGTAKQFFDNWALGKKPELMAKFAPEVEFEGRKVNSGVILAQELQYLVDKYRRLQQIRGFGENVIQHVDQIFKSPIGSFMSPSDVIDQILNFRNTTRDQFLAKAGNAGFIKEFLYPEFTEEDRDIYSHLNRKENNKDAQEIKNKLLKG